MGHSKQEAFQRVVEPFILVRKRKFTWHGEGGLFPCHSENSSGYSGA